jgi:2-oxopent-4-enoate/cis-2-oxohex-4-enoate hydratase
MKRFDEAKVRRYGGELYEALRSRRSVAPLTEREPEITIEDAYRIQMHLVGLRLERDGETVVGKKIGVTSEVVQKALAVDQPDFGHLTSAMAFRDGDTLPASQLILPRAEGEIAFVLKQDLTGPGVTPDDVLRATDRVVACFEIVDSRIHDWKIRIQDTIADNASSALFVLGSQSASPHEVDLVGCRMELTKNGEVVGGGTGAASLGSPLKAMAWLANTLGSFGIVLRAGEVILSGSLGPLVPVSPGDRMRVSIEGMGTAAVEFA